MFSALENLKIRIEGGSHSERISLFVDGLPKGIKIDKKKLQKYVDRRKAQKAAYSTSRIEGDIVNFASGINENGELTGDTLEAYVLNTSQHSNDYTNLKNTPRPGHADFVASVKYGGKLDMNGGGPFSGRMTLAICILGGIAKQILLKNNIEVEGYISSIAGITSKSYKDSIISLDEIKNADPLFRVLDENKAKLMKEKISEAKENLDSVGGMVDCIAYNVPVGIGGPLFEGFEGKVSYAMFAIPAVKGVEFGAGFDISNMKGSTANDCFYYDENKKVKTYTNNNGGINGGITNGMPITMRVAFKPVPSIARPQKTINIETKENTIIEIKGRHDACIVPRAVVCVESMLLICLLDSLI